MLLGLYTPLVTAAPTTYSFDTLTKHSLHASAPSLTGVLRNETSPMTVSFVDNTQRQLPLHRQSLVFLSS